MQKELQEIMDEFGADTGTVHLMEDGVLILKAHAGVPEQVLAVVRVVPVGKGMAGMAQGRNEPVSSCNLQQDESADIPAGAKATGVNGAIVVPIRDRNGAAVGAVGIGVHRDYEFSDAETARLLELATTLSRDGQATTSA
jgi:L-methionine (R)-S-oxide reductase